MQTLFRGVGTALEGTLITDRFHSYLFCSVKLVVVLSQRFFCELCFTGIVQIVKSIEFTRSFIVQCASCLHRHRLLIIHPDLVDHALGSSVKYLAT